MVAGASWAEDGVATVGVLLALGDTLVSFGSESWQPARKAASVRLIIPKPKYVDLLIFIAEMNIGGIVLWSLSS